MLMMGSCLSINSSPIITRLLVVVIVTWYILPIARAIAVVTLARAAVVTMTVAMMAASVMTIAIALIVAITLVITPVMWAG